MSKLVYPAVPVTQFAKLVFSIRITAPLAKKFQAILISIISNALLNVLTNILEI